MNQPSERIFEAIKEYRKSVNKIIEDGMAFWGQPESDQPIIVEEQQHGKQKDP